MKRLVYSNRIVSLLKNGGVGVLPTDTLYGLVGSALSPKTVERIYTLRSRESSKPLIVLIASADDLSLFDIQLTPTTKEVIKASWPGPVSIVFPCRNSKYRYLHRGSKTIAFRLPADKALLRFLKKTGPLVAPSANPAGKKPAYTIQQAKRYFQENVDFYLDSGLRKGPPSTVIKTFKGRSVTVLR